MPADLSEGTAEAVFQELLMSSRPPRSFVTKVQFNRFNLACLVGKIYLAGSIRQVQSEQQVINTNNEDENKKEENEDEDEEEESGQSKSNRKETSESQDERSNLIKVRQFTDVSGKKNEKFVRKNLKGD